MPANLKTIILAAGQGKRLMPHTANTPKCLINVGGHPILHHQLAALEKNNLLDIIIVTGFMAEAIEQYASRNFPEMRFTYIRNPRFAETNTFYSLALASSAVGPQEAVLQLNGDVVFHPSVVAGLIENPDASKLAVQKKKCGEEEIKCILSPDGSIMNLNKTCSPDYSIGEAVGVNFFASKEWAAVSRFLQFNQDRHPDKYFEYALEKSIADDCNFFPHFIETHHAIEIDFPEDLARARGIFPSAGNHDISLVNNPGA